MRRMETGLAFGVCLAVAVVANAGTPAPTSVYLEPVEDSAVQGIAVEKVEKALRERLARDKRMQLVTSAEEAALVLSVAECLAWGEKKRVTEITDRTPNLPTDGLGGRRGPDAWGTRTENRTRVSLVVRASWKDRFHDLASHEDDRTLKAATDSVAGALSRLLKAPRQP
jgi:hypothetical protein